MSPCQCLCFAVFPSVRIQPDYGLAKRPTSRSVVSTTPFFGQALHSRVRARRHAIKPSSSRDLLHASPNLLSDPIIAQETLSPPVDVSAVAKPPEPTVVEVEFAPGKVARFETGRIARQADGAVLTRLGDTVVISTACVGGRENAPSDSLPLRVDYSEKFSSVGRTVGSYVKREGRASEREVLMARLIDRPLRPMFTDGFCKEVQVISTVYSFDGTNGMDALSICGVAAALHISSIPLVEPVAAVRIAYVNGTFVVEPNVEDAKQSGSSFVVAGSRSGISMVEGYCDFLSEEKIIEGMQLAHLSIIKLCDAMDELREKTGNVEKDKTDLQVVSAATVAKVAELAIGLDEAIGVVGKKARDEKITELKDRVFKTLSPTREEELNDPDDAAMKENMLRMAWKSVVTERMCRRILDHNVRPDGRGVDVVRPITIDQAMLPCAHGSSLFTRGETQTLAVATIGGDEMSQRFETLEGDYESRFYLQYSFPPFSVGEVGRIGAPKRRDIGHGKLAERAIQAAIPSQDDFPYVLRVESNVMESNGSSSMASVCGGCLALLDAGVPLKCSVAGVAMGFILDKWQEVDPETGEHHSVVLTDISGMEDALGSCDAKFAGNRDGLSALQLDVKVRGISIASFSRILKQAANARIRILDCMDAVMPHKRSKLPDSVPSMEVMQISPSRIGNVIGPGGRVIRDIIEKCGGENVLRISIEKEGRVSFSSRDREMIEKAMGIVSSIAASVSMTVGMEVKGKVTKILPFGAYVEVATGKEGWLHISELEHKRTQNVKDICDVGDIIEVKVIELGRNGQIKVSRKACLPTIK